MKLAAIQMQPSGDTSKSISRAAEMIEEAVSKGAGVILLPELFAAPFVAPEPDKDYFELAESLTGPSNEMVSELSRKHRITIVSSIFEERDIPGTYSNTACTFADGEMRSVYRKSHLPFSNGFPEKFYFRPGDVAPEVVHTDQASVGTVICYERHFPELARSVAIQGGTVLCNPVASASAPMKEVFQLELRAHAVFNSMYVMCSNRIGFEGSKEYFGLSAVYGPNGEILAQAPDGQEDVVLADYSIDEIKNARKSRPIFRDRRPDLYHHLTNS